MLRLFIEDEPADGSALPLRQGRAIAWITEALVSLRSDFSDEQLHQLVLSIRAAVGIEAIVWLVDVACLSRNDAVAPTRWSAQALLEYATTVAPPTPNRRHPMASEIAHADQSPEPIVGAHGAPYATTFAPT